MIFVTANQQANGTGSKAFSKSIHIRPAQVFFPTIQNSTRLYGRNANLSRPDIDDINLIPTQ